MLLPVLNYFIILHCSGNGESCGIIKLCEIHHHKYKQMWGSGALAHLLLILWIKWSRRKVKLAFLHSYALFFMFPRFQCFQFSLISACSISFSDLKLTKEEDAVAIVSEKLSKKLKRFHFRFSLFILIKSVSLAGGTQFISLEFIRKYRGSVNDINNL